MPALGGVRFVTAGALGLGLYSLAALGLGMLGVLNRNTAMAFPLLSIAVFLATNESRMITGAAIPADGGRSAY